MKKIIIYEVCKRYGRTLTAKKSIKDKMGKICKKHEEKKQENQIYIKGF